MRRIKMMPQYVNRVRGRDGVNRYYYRRAGRKAVSLPSPSSPDFAAAYDAARLGAEPVTIGAKRTKPGTTAAVVALYIASAKHSKCAPETQRTRRNIMEHFCRARDRRGEAYGDKRVSAIEPRHIRLIIDAKSETPSAARNLLAVLRILMQTAIGAGMRPDDPTAGVERPRIVTDGYTTWEEEHIAAFKARHPLGSRARLALELLLCTGQRRGDVIRMGPQDMRRGMIPVRQQKTGEPLMLPVHPDLRAAIDATTTGIRTFVVTEKGEQFSPAGFTNWFRRMCNEAGLPNGFSAHGLRKAMCRRLAEAGCSEKLIAAISGHRTLRMVQKYTQAADQERMATEAFARLATYKH